MRNILIITAFLAIVSCAQQQEAGKGTTAITTTNENFPQLLQRAEAIRNGKEWDDIQNYYGTQCAELRKSPDNQDARLKLAECFIQEARVTGEHPHYYPAALAMVEQVVTALENKQEKNPNQKDMLFRALSHKASVQLSLHDFKAALETAKKAVALNPYNAYIYGCLVDANVELGNYDEAVAMCDKMISIRPDLRSYARVSYLREIHNDTKGAVEAMKMAVDAGYPGYEQTEWARLQLGGLYQKMGNFKAAENQYQMSLQVRENYPFAIAALAELEAEKGNTVKALELFKKASEIIPEIGFYIEMAKIYKKTGDTANFDQTVASVKTMFEEDMAAGHNMSLEAARFYLDVVGDKAQARRFAQEENATRPNNKDVKALMAIVER